MNMMQRLNAPTPKFFRLLRMTVADTVMTVVSQTAVESEEPNHENVILLLSIPLSTIT